MTKIDTFFLSIDKNTCPLRTGNKSILDNQNIFKIQKRGNHLFIQLKVRPSTRAEINSYPRQADIYVGIYAKHERFLTVYPSTKIGRFIIEDKAKRFYMSSNK
jgi:hypothetical protein